MPDPRWPEVSNWVSSIKLLRPICELSVDQSSPPPGAAAEGGGAVLPPAPPAAPGSDPIDPALWYCHTLNRLQLRLAPGSLTNVHPEGLSRLSSLSTLILSGNSLTWCLTPPPPLLFNIFEFLERPCFLMSQFCYLYT